MTSHLLFPGAPWDDGDLCTDHVSPGTPSADDYKHSAEHLMLARPLDLRGVLVPLCASPWQCSPCTGCPDAPDASSFLAIPRFLIHLMHLSWSRVQSRSFLGGGAGRLDSGLKNHLIPPNGLVVATWPKIAAWNFWLDRATVRHSARSARHLRLVCGSNVIA